MLSLSLISQPTPSQDVQITVPFYSLSKKHDTIGSHFIQENTVSGDQAEMNGTHFASNIYILKVTEVQ